MDVAVNWQWLDRIKRFVVRFWYSFDESQCLMWATTLCYATLLAIVPLMAVTLAVASGFPVFENWTGQIQRFVFENFVPATSEVIQEYLNRFVGRASQMPAIGVVFLVASALLLMLNIDGALNRIWRVSKPRHLASRLLSYWALLTLGPLLMIASVAISSYLVTLPILAPARSTTFADWMLQLAPFATSTFGFFIVYLVIPNRRVFWRNALAGAVVAGLLFEVTKAGFAFYVTHFPAYRAVYGAFAAIPVFLVWVYLSWLVTLVGATFAATLGERDRVVRRSGRAGAIDLIHAYRLLAYLWDAQRHGRGFSIADLGDVESDLAEWELERLLKRLASADFVHQDEDERWFLARDVSSTSLLQLMRDAAPVVVALPRPDGWESDGSSSREALLHDAFHELDAPVKSAFDRPLREFFEGGRSHAT
jgi:membrane protein